MAPRKTGRHAKTRPPRPLWQEFIGLAVIAVLIAFLVKTFLIQAFYIPSGSMQETLAIGDRVLVNKLVYRFGEIKRGDIVVFDGTDSFVVAGAPPDETNPALRVARGALSFIGLMPSSDEHDFVKRVIGVGGDRVACCDEDGRLTVNGVPVDEPYLYPGNAASDQPFDIEVPEGRLWVMGDHRSNSADSRSHLGSPGGGTVSEDRVVGRVFAVVWPLGQARWIGGHDAPAASAADKPMIIGQAVAAGPVLAAALLAVPCRLTLRRRLEGRRQ